jgi:DNA repair protein RecO
MDIINKISFHDNPCDIIFRLTKKTLIKFDQTHYKNIQLYYIFFQIQLLIYLGYHPSFFQCYQCNKKINQGSFNTKIGQILCLSCSTYNKEIINSEILENLKFLMSTHIDNIENKINCNNLIVINNLLYKFISYHVPEIRKSKLFISEK